MKIFAPYKPFAVGGPATFLSNFAQQVKQQGHEVITKFQPDFDLLFVLESCSLAYAFYAKTHGKKIIQRLDGTYYPALPNPAGRFYQIKNLRHKIFHNYLADHVVYQSIYSKNLCQEFLGKRRGASSIIYNATTLHSQSDHKIVAPSPLKLITFAKFRRPDQIEPLIASVQNLTRPYQFNIYGPHSQNLSPIFSALDAEPRITYHGSRTHAELIEALNDSDIFLFSDQSACPNSVIESLAAGVPVVAYDRGSIAELVTPRRTGQIVPLKPHSPWYNMYQFNSTDFKNFAQSIETTARNLVHYHHFARLEAIRRYNLRRMVNQYLAVFNSA